MSLKKSISLFATISILISYRWLSKILVIPDVFRKSGLICLSFGILRYYCFLLFSHINRQVSFVSQSDFISCFKDTQWSLWQLFWLAKFYVLIILNFYLNMKMWSNKDEIYALHTHFLYLVYILAFIVDLAFLRILACGQVFSKTNWDIDTRFAGL